MIRPRTAPRALAYPDVDVGSVRALQEQHGLAPSRNTPVNAITPMIHMRWRLRPVDLPPDATFMARARRIQHRASEDDDRHEDHGEPDDVGAQIEERPGTR
jgi:hypothetical protein